MKPFIIRRPKAFIIRRPWGRYGVADNRPVVHRDTECPIGTVRKLSDGVYLALGIGWRRDTPPGSEGGALFRTEREAAQHLYDNRVDLADRHPYRVELWGGRGDRPSAEIHYVKAETLRLALFLARERCRAPHCLLGTPRVTRVTMAEYWQHN